MDKETKYHIHESPKTMTTPLIILAGLSAVGGYLSLPEFISKHNLWNSYIDKIIIFKKEILFAHSAEINLTILSSAIALFGIFLAWYLYVKNIRLCNKLASSFKFFHKLSYDKYYIDEIYEFVFINPVVYGSEGIYQWFDIAVIDGIVNGSGKASLGSGNLLSYFQSGFLRDYIYHIIIGAILILTIFIAGL